MKTIHVPYLDGVCAQSKEAVTKQFDALSDVYFIDQLNWPDLFSYAPQTRFQIFRTETHLFIRYQVKGEGLRAVNTENNSPVWQDSCVEFFVQVPNYEGYFNFEFNCIGTCLAAKRANREEFISLTDDQHKQIIKYSSVGSTPFEERSGEHAWELIVGIPYSLIDLDPTHLPQAIRANFFKCGDATQKIHYVSWSPIDWPKPNFHLPQFFGELRF